jgi:Mlc titration factor MtfA (ptsG expression regulator)
MMGYKKADRPYAIEKSGRVFCGGQFFEAPATLREHLPDVYRQLAQFYRQHRSEHSVFKTEPQRVRQAKEVR